MISRWPLVDPEFDRVHDRVCLAVDHRNHRAVFAGDVDKSVGAELQRMRRDVRAQVDDRRVRAIVEIDDAEQVAGIWIAAVDAVAENRHVGAARSRAPQQLVDGALEARRA